MLLSVFIEPCTYNKPNKSYHLMQQITPPSSDDELMRRVQLIAGSQLGALANSINVDIPENLKREKGWVGQLVEKILGATAGNKPEPDFQSIGVELKTLPIDSRGFPSESTYVCVVPLAHTEGLYWENSLVRQKLNKVLWLPIEADKNIPLAKRRVGMGILWSPDDATESKLARDYDEFIDSITLGEVESITAHQGEFLQIRPKAANSSVVTQGIGEMGQSIKTLPRGFYLRPAFTREIIRQWQNQPAN